MSANSPVDGETAFTEKTFAIDQLSVLKKRRRLEPAHGHKTSKKFHLNDYSDDLHQKNFMNEMILSTPN